jgi:hypothetical protein
MPERQVGNPGPGRKGLSALYWGASAHRRIYNARRVLYTPLSVDAPLLGAAGCGVHAASSVARSALRPQIRVSRVGHSVVRWKTGARPGH